MQSRHFSLPWQQIHDFGLESFSHQYPLLIRAVVVVALSRHPRSSKRRNELDRRRKNLKYWCTSVSPSCSQWAFHRLELTIAVSPNVKCSSGSTSCTWLMGDKFSFSLMKCTTSRQHTYQCNKRRCIAEFGFSNFLYPPINDRYTVIRSYIAHAFQGESVREEREREKKCRSKKNWWTAQDCKIRTLSRTWDCEWFHDCEWTWTQVVSGSLDPCQYCIRESMAWL